MAAIGLLAKAMGSFLDGKLGERLPRAQLVALALA
jgi:hypothetical protein